jgi:CMP-N-acetylneuraminic acid synthetase
MSESDPYTLGLIPARGGSKGIPRKNLRPLGGKPLLVYTVEAARRSKSLSLVATSTEDGEIAHVAQEAGSTVIARPPELARDETPTLPVVLHAIEVMERQLQQVLDYVVILQVTTPFRTGEDIDRAVEMLIRSSADSIVSVREAQEVHPWKLKRIVEGKLVSYLEQEVEGTRRQDLPPVYVRNGGIYAVRRNVVMVQNSLYGDDCRAYVMPPERSIDIDSELDLILAEALLERGVVSG